VLFAGPLLLFIVGHDPTKAAPVHLIKSANTGFVRFCPKITRRRALDDVLFLFLD
jgi:hypothetical protein